MSADIPSLVLKIREEIDNLLSQNEVPLEQKVASRHRGAIDLEQILRTTVHEYKDKQRDIRTLTQSSNRIINLLSQEISEKARIEQMHQSEVSQLKWTIEHLEQDNQELRQEIRGYQQKMGLAETRFTELSEEKMQLEEQIQRELQNLTEKLHQKHEKMKIAYKDQIYHFQQQIQALRLTVNDLYYEREQLVENLTKTEKETEKLRSQIQRLESVRTFELSKSENLSKENLCLMIKLQQTVGSLEAARSRANFFEQSDVQSRSEHNFNYLQMLPKLSSSESMKTFEIRNEEEQENPEQIRITSQMLSSEIDEVPQSLQYSQESTSRNEETAEGAVNEAKTKEQGFFKWAFISLRKRVVDNRIRQNTARFNVFR